MARATRSLSGTVLLHPAGGSSGSGLECVGACGGDVPLFQEFGGSDGETCGGDWIR